MNKAGLWRAMARLAPAGLCCAAVAGGGSINFEEFPADDTNGTIPPGRYAGIGVTFMGTDDSTTWGGLGAGDPGNWDLEGTNGSTFSGFNGASYGVTLLFDSDISGFSLDASRANGSVDGVITVEGYNDGLLVNSVSATMADINVWTTISVPGTFDEVVISGTGSGFHPYGIDNLQWNGGGNDCPWDLNNDGVVGPPDLAALLAGWGNPYGPADLAALLAAWGPCNVCGPGAGPCGQPNGTPGCNDVDCCELICSKDPFCCDVEWDSICAAAAQDLCMPPVPPCCQPGDIPEGEPCGTDNNGGCNSSPPAFFQAQCNASYCGNAWADQGTRDTDWYLISVSTQTEIRGTLASQFDGVVFIVDGIDACAPIVIGESGASVNCDPIGQAVACVPPGNYVVFVAPAAFDGTPCGTTNSYRLTIECAPCAPPNPCNPNAGPCDVPNGSPGCDDPACCDLICSQDPFCCDVEWDQICADAAIEQCGGPPTPCNPNAGPCEEPNGTPGCDDPACCDLICSQDPFCCDVEWDQICANAAIEQCGPCNPNAGPCEAPNGTPGCNDPECCELICSQDPFCCDVEWDQICANAAIEQCGGGASDCCEPNGTPGCDNQACQDLICSQDPFCCDNQWDGICANAAIEQCAVCQ